MSAAVAAILACACGSDDEAAPALDNGGSGGGDGNGNTGNTSGSSSSGAGPGPADPIPTVTPEGGVAPTLVDLAEDPAPEAAWTILVYGHADHNLSLSLLNDMREMSRAQLSEDVQVLVLTDWDSSQVIADTEPPQNYPEGVQLFYVRGGGQSPVLLAEEEEANLDDPAILSTLVEGVFAALPARHRGLILWDHGGSWRGGFGSDSQNGTAQAYSPMSANAVAQAVQQGLQAAAITATPPLDFFAFDTCLMAGAEVAYEFRDLASVYMADAEIDYGNGWDYEETFSYIAANPDVPVLELAAAEVSHWDAHHAGAGVDDDLLRSHVALDLSRMASFAESTQTLVSALVNSQSFDPLDLGRSTYFSVAPYHSQFGGGSDEPGLRDMGQVLEALGGTEGDATVSLAARNARQALEGLVIARSQGALRTARAQAAVHVDQTVGSEVTPQFLEFYASRATAWVEASGWDQMLSLAGSFATNEPPLVQRTIVNAAASRTAPPALQITSADPTIAKAEVYIASVDAGGNIAIVGLAGSGLMRPGETREFVWDGAVAQFADGQRAMVDMWLDFGDTELGPILSIPGRVQGIPDVDSMTLVFGASESRSRSAVFAQGDQNTTMRLSEVVEAYPEATFTPVYLQIPTGQTDPVEMLGQPMAIPADGFELTQAYLEAGTYALLTSTVGIWGNEALEVDAVTLTEPLGP